MPQCTYEYMCGKKKNTKCGRVVRKKDESFCFAHRPKNVEPVVEIIKTKNIEIPKPVKDNIKPKKIEKKVEKSPIKKKEEIPELITEESESYTISYKSGVVHHQKKPPTLW